MMESKEGKPIESQKQNFKRQFIVHLFKSIWIPICIGIISLALFFCFLPMKNNISKRFITPYQNSVTKQDPNLYIVSTYYANDETSVKFLQTLNQLEKKYKIPYYLVNASSYPDILEAWEIKYWPTYFIFERKESDKDAVLVYKSYGNKEASALSKEITNVRKYGMPVSNIGGTLSIKDDKDTNILDLTLVSVKPSENDNNQFTIEFYVENKTKDELIVNYSDFIVTSNTWDKEKDPTSAANLNESDQLKLAANKKENILISYSGSFPYNQIDMFYRVSSESTNQYKWTYKIWPVED